MVFIANFLELIWSVLLEISVLFWTMNKKTCDHQKDAE